MLQVHPEKWGPGVRVNCAFLDGRDKHLERGAAAVFCPSVPQFLPSPRHLSKRACRLAACPRAATPAPMEKLTSEDEEDLGELLSCRLGCALHRGAKVILVEGIGPSCPRDKLCIPE